MHKPEFDWIYKWAKYTPNRMVLREYDRDIKWSYYDLNNRINALANYLYDEYHFRKGQRIAIYSRNRAEYIFLFFAGIRLGVILVPLNSRLMPRELDILINDAKPSLFLFEKKYSEQCKELKSLENVPHCLPVENISPFLTEPITEIDFSIEQSFKEEDAVMILYTSGTTGVPKGVVINHKMLFWNSINTSLRLDINSRDHTQSFAPLFHTGGWNVLLTPFIHHGGSHTILSDFDTELILELIEKEQSTILFGVPTMMQMLANSPNFKSTDLSSIRYAVVGGAPMPIPLINVWHKKGIAIRQGYGLTEVGPNCFSLHQDDAIRKRGSIGFPNFYIDAKIMGNNGKECSFNEVGELWLKSPVVTPGYWNKPAETKATITDGWFHTGDMVIKDSEGYFFVVDRKKNMFISGGENVYPAEVETLLITNKDIKEAAVIGVSDERWGEVGHAFIVSSRKALTIDDIKTFCLGQLAKYKIPKYFTIVKELPLNETGKLNRMKLIELHSNS